MQKSTDKCCSDTDHYESVNGNISNSTERNCPRLGAQMRKYAYSVIIDRELSKLTKEAVSEDDIKYPQMVMHNVVWLSGIHAVASALQEAFGPPEPEMKHLDAIISLKEMRKRLAHYGELVEHKPSYWIFPKHGIHERLIDISDVFDSDMKPINDSLKEEIMTDEYWIDTCLPWVELGKEFLRTFRVAKREKLENLD